MKFRIAAATLAALLPIACSDGDRSYTIDEVRKDRPPEIPRGASLSDLQRLGLARGPMSGQDNPHASNPHGGDPHGGARIEFAFDLPEGWKQISPQQFRDLNFTLERDPSLECYLTVMPGGGGGLESNIARWRGQMNLPPMPAEEIAKLPRLEFFGEDAPMVSMTGTFNVRGGPAKPDYGFLGVFLGRSDTAVTLKMTGPAAIVEQERERFRALASSLRVGGGHGGGNAAKPPAPSGGDDGMSLGMATGASGFAWTAPDGWTVGKRRNMRVVTFHPEGKEDAECYVSMMSGTGGGVDMNVNNWLSQIGRPPLKPAEVSALPTVDMLGAKGVVLDASGGQYVGMDGKEAGKEGESYGLMGIVCVLDGRSVFVKMIGPAELVARQRENFLAFAKSLRVEE